MRLLLPDGCGEFSACTCVVRMLLYSLKRADLIVALDRFMKERIRAKGISAEKILVVPPWSHDDRVRFDPAGREEFRKNHKLSDKFVVMYSGNHSPCHPLETLLQAAERLADHDDIAFCFVGGGSEFRKVQERARERGMRNVLCLPYQPIGRLVGVLVRGRFASCSDGRTVCWYCSSLQDLQCLGCGQGLSLHWSKGKPHE